MSTVLTVPEPEYWQDACKHLMKRDRVMKKFTKAAKLAAR